MEGQEKVILLGTLPCSAGPSRCDPCCCPPSATLASPPSPCPPVQDKAARWSCQYFKRTPHHSCYPSRSGRSCMATPSPLCSQTCHVCWKHGGGSRTEASHDPWSSRPLGAANVSAHTPLLHRNSLSFNFIRLTTYLLLQRSIDGLAWGVPFNPHCIGYFHSSVRICITGHKE